MLKTWKEVKSQLSNLSSQLKHPETKSEIDPEQKEGNGSWEQKSMKWKRKYSQGSQQETDEFLEKTNKTNLLRSKKWREAQTTNVGMTRGRPQTLQAPEGWWNTADGPHTRAATQTDRTSASETSRTSTHRDEIDLE